MKSYTLIIPDWKPVSLNAMAGHWAARSRKKKSDRDIVAAYARQQSIPPATGLRWVSVEVAIGNARGRTPDPDNFLKSLLDALVCCGLLVDDRYQFCRLREVSVIRGYNKQTRIVLEEE